MKKTTIFFLEPIKFFVSLFSVIFIAVCLPLIHSKKQKIIFGSSPILNIKYWSEALNEIGIPSITLVRNFYSSINKRGDFDVYFEDLTPSFIKNKFINESLYPFFVWLYIIRNAKVVVLPLHGFTLRDYFWKLEYLFLKLKGIKIIALPYGSDGFMYSKIKSKSLQHALIADYPDAGKLESKIKSKVLFWSKYANFITPGLLYNDGFPRWDIAPHQFISINSKTITKKKEFSSANGINEEVKILHAPNHRTFKGTEFFLNAIDELKKEGYKINLILLEKVPNDKVLEIMSESDILADQFIFTGYSLNSIEGMAVGLPVLSNLENDELLEVSRRYSFLNECPILSSSPETIKERLKILITSPELRKELGELGLLFVDKYHSYTSAQYMFSNIFKKLEGEDIDLMNLYHPLKSEYVKTNYIHTPLKNNKYVGPAR